MRVLVVVPDEVVHISYQIGDAAKSAAAEGAPSLSSTKMHGRILYIWDDDYPWDVRVEKICTSLSTHGHEVHIAARNLKRQAEYELVGGLHVHRLGGWKNERINQALSFPAFFSPVWVRFLDRIVGAHRIQLVIVRDLPMALAGIWVARKNRIRVILDMAEDYVAMLEKYWHANRLRPLNFFVRNPHFAAKVAKVALRSVDHILIVTKEAMEVVRKYGGHVQHVTIVGNTPRPESFDAPLLNNAQLRIMKNRVCAIYTGGLQTGRGLRTLIEAIKYVAPEIPAFLVVIAGAGHEANALKKFAEQEGLGSHVLWLGRLRHEELFAYIAASDVGVIPHLINDHVNTTLPNKLFDYMGCGVPVAASNAEPLRRVLSEEKCGVTFDPADVHDLARALLDVLSSPGHYGKNGRSAVMAKYNWMVDEKRLLDVVHLMLPT